MDSIASRTAASLLVAAIGASAVAGVLAVRQAAPGFDFRTVPPPHAETESALRARGTSLVEAIAIAERVTGGGIAAEAASVRRAEPHDTVSVLVYHDDGDASRVLVDAATGSVLERTAVPRLPGDPVEGEPVEGPSGVRWWVLEEGAGDPPPTDDSNVRVEYAGYLLDGTRFDSTEAIGRPVTLPLSSFLPGWALGMRDMLPGERRKLLVPSELAFGALGNPPSIPPDATLVIDVTLERVVDFVNLPETIPGWRVEGEPTRTESGLRWWEVEAGDPAGQAVPGLDAIVELHVTGYLTDGSTFTRTRDEAGGGAPIRVDLRRWLTGAAEGVVGMRPGDRRKLVVPGRLGYGSTGRRRVPPNATLIMDVEMIGFADR